MANNRGFESLRRALVGNFAGRGLQLLFMFASSIVLARQLGPAGLGVYAVALAAVRLALIPAVEGFARLAEREIAGAQADDDGATARAVVRFAAFGALGAVGLGGVLVNAFISAGPLGAELDAAEIAALAVAVLCVEAGAGVLRGVLRGAGRTTDAMIALNATALMTPAAFLAYPLLGGDPSPAAALALRCGAVLATVPLWLVLIRRAWPRGFAGARTGRRKRGWWSESAQFALLGAVQAGLTEIGLLMIGVYGSAEQAGQFRIATRVYVIANFAALAVRMAAGPRIALAWRKGQRRELEEEARRLATLASAFAVCATLGFALLGEPLLRLAFGADFAAAYAPALLLCAAALVGAAAALASMLLRMSGHQLWVIVGSVAGLGVAVALNVALTPSLGAMGGAIAFVAAVLASQAIYVAAAIRQLRVNPILTIPTRAIFRI